jgi:hypothetical protein
LKFEVEVRSTFTYFAKPLVFLFLSLPPQITIVVVVVVVFVAVDVVVDVVVVFLPMYLLSSWHYLLSVPYRCTYY